MKNQKHRTIGPREKHLAAVQLESDCELQISADFLISEQDADTSVRTSHYSTKKKKKNRQKGTFAQFIDSTCILGNTFYNLLFTSIKYWHNIHFQKDRR